MSKQVSSHCIDCTRSFDEKLIPKSCQYCKQYRCINCSLEHYCSMKPPATWNIDTQLLAPNRKRKSQVEETGKAETDKNINKKVPTAGTETETQNLTEYAGNITEEESPRKSPAEVIDLIATNDDPVDITEALLTRVQTSSELIATHINIQNELPLLNEERQTEANCCSHNYQTAEPPRLNFDEYNLTDADSRFVAIMPEIYSQGYRVAQNKKTNHTFIFGERYSKKITGQKCEHGFVFLQALVPLVINSPESDDSTDSCGNVSPINMVFCHEKQVKEFVNKSDISWELVLVPVEDVNQYYRSTKEHVTMFLDDDILNDVVTSVVLHLKNSKEIAYLEDDAIEILDSGSDSDEDLTGLGSEDKSNHSKAIKSATDLSDDDVDTDLAIPMPKLPMTPADKSQYAPGSNPPRNKSGRNSKPPDVLTYTDATLAKKYSSQQTADRWKKALAAYEKLSGEKYDRRKGDRIDHFEMLVANLEEDRGKRELEREQRKKRELQERIEAKTKPPTKSYSSKADDNSTPLGANVVANVSVTQNQASIIRRENTANDNAKDATETIINMIDYISSIETKMHLKNKKTFDEQRDLDIIRRDVGCTTTTATQQVVSQQVTSATLQQTTTHTSGFEASEAYQRAKYEYENRNSYNSWQHFSDSRIYETRQHQWQYDDCRPYYYDGRDRPSYCDTGRDQRFHQEPFQYTKNYQMPPRPHPQQFPTQQHPQRTPQRYHPSPEYSQRPNHLPQGSQYQQVPSSQQHKTPQQNHASQQSQYSNQPQIPQHNWAPQQSQHLNPSEHQTPIQRRKQYSETYERVCEDKFEFESRHSGSECEYRRERSDFETIPERWRPDFAKQQSNYCASEIAPEEEYYEPFVRPRDYYYQNPAPRDTYSQNPFNN